MHSGLFKLRHSDPVIRIGRNWIGNSQKHEVIARSVARMSFRIHGVQDFHFSSIADGASDVLKGLGGRWRGFDPSKAEKEREASLFAFFGLNTG